MSGAIDIQERRIRLQQRLKTRERLHAVLLKPESGGGTAASSANDASGSPAETTTNASTKKTLRKEAATNALSPKDERTTKPPKSSQSASLSSSSFPSAGAASASAASLSLTSTSTTLVRPSSVVLVSPSSSTSINNNHQNSPPTATTSAVSKSDPSIPPPNMSSSLISSTLTSSTTPLLLMKESTLLEDDVDFTVTSTTAKTTTIGGAAPKKTTSSAADGGDGKEKGSSGQTEEEEEENAVDDEDMSAEDAINALLSTQSTKDKEKAKVTNEINDLLNTPSAIQHAISNKFKSDGSNMKEFCQKGTRDECRKHLGKDGKPCEKLHFKKIIQRHTDISLGDCSFLNTCFHMDTCKYIHYQVDYSTPHDKQSSSSRHHRQQTSPSNSNSHDTDSPSGKKIRRASGGSSKSKDNEAGRSLALPGASCTAGDEALNVSFLLEGKANVNLYPAQWVQCDLRFFDLSVLGKCSVVMADPPWDIHMELPYGTMQDDEMRHLKVNLLQDEGLIFLWVTGRAMELGRECLALWGYKQVDEIIWVKTNQLQRIIRTGRTGHWLNHGKEHCLVGVKGSMDKYCRGLDSDVIVAEVRATSHKPDEVYGMIERLAPGTRKVELFGRHHNIQPNWITLGNQLDGVRLVDPEIVSRFQTRYPSGSCMPTKEDVLRYREEIRQTYPRRKQNWTSQHQSTRGFFSKNRYGQNRDQSFDRSRKYERGRQSQVHHFSPSTTTRSLSLEHGAARVLNRRDSTKSYQSSAQANLFSDLRGVRGQHSKNEDSRYADRPRTSASNGLSKSPLPYQSDRHPKSRNPHDQMDRRKRLIEEDERGRMDRKSWSPLTVRQQAFNSHRYDSHSSSSHSSARSSRSPVHNDHRASSSNPTKNSRRTSLSSSVTSHLCDNYRDRHSRR